MQNIKFSTGTSGVINPLDRIIIKKIIHMNTKFRDNYYTTPSSNFKYNFPIPINNVLSMRLRSIDIPNTWYTFSSRYGNNRFIIETEMGRRALCKTSIFEIIIPDGNYDAIQLSNYINNTYLLEKNYNFTGLTFDIDSVQIDNWDNTDRNSKNSICCDL